MNTRIDAFLKHSTPNVTGEHDKESHVHVAPDQSTKDSNNPDFEHPSNSQANEDSFFMIYTNLVSKKYEGSEAMDIRATDNVQDCNSKYDYEGKLAIYVAFKLRGVVGNYKVTNGIYVSPLQMFNLSDFVIVRPLFYSSRHADGCLECSHLVEFAKAIKESGTVELADTYRMIFSNLDYKSDLVIRKIMQLPVSVFRMQLHCPGSAKLFVTEKIDGVDYNSFVAKGMFCLKIKQENPQGTL